MKQLAEPAAEEHLLESRYRQVTQSIRAACNSAGRDPADIKVVAVSKTKPGSAVAELAAAGQKHFGENYLQEATAKIKKLEDLELTWHFIGSIQSNKTRAIAENFAWVHTVDRLRVARRLNQARAEMVEPLNVCIQVNIDNEPQKSGVTPAACEELAHEVHALPALRLRGLMVLPDQQDDMRPAFARTRKLFETLRPVGSSSWDTLSMGMSGDFACAIDEGATMIRLGTVLFGERK